ncbi:Rv1678 family membrane protein [Glycomyces xiaoerkulensis]|uniref:Rv1678 family membrane protein n=1 Tax=Glycomyces xiaoerkulensis TaxID=2038139 RepID=UPI000C25E6F4|nr:hypothetical protein [Glycomyces xiaoerkulensis]
MSGAHRFDRAAITLGLASIAAVVFALDLGEFRFMTVGGASIAVALGLGGLAVVAGAASWRPLTVLIGIGFAAAAALQLIAAAVGGDWMGGNLSTMSFWIGLAAGLVLAGAAPRNQTSDERE